MFKNLKKGFTIVELVIVIAVIAILAGVLIPTFSSVTKNAKTSAALQQAKNGLESTLTLTGGSYPEGTDFIVTDGDGSVDYWFTYKNQALQNEKSVIEKYDNDSTNGYYACYFSAECFDGKNTKTGASLGATDKDPELSTSEKLLIAAFKETGNPLASAGTVTASFGTVTADNYYLATLTDGTNEVKVRVYFTSDIKPTLVIVLGSNN